jgi:hypothetical protein
MAIRGVSTDQWLPGRGECDTAPLDGRHDAVGGPSMSYSGGHSLAGPNYPCG